MRADDISVDQLYAMCLVTGVQVHTYLPHGVHKIKPMWRRGKEYWIAAKNDFTRRMYVGFIADADFTGDVVKLCCERLKPECRTLFWELLCE